MRATRFTELIGCTVPIPPLELTVAVSNAGALGMHGSAWLGAGSPGSTTSRLSAS
jgi:hypothetical protein